MAAQSVGYLQQLGTPELYHARDTVLLFYRLTLVIIVVLDNELLNLQAMRRI